MLSFTKLALSAVLALVACTSLTSALPTDSTSLNARSLGDLPSGNTLDGRLLRKRLAKLKRASKVNAAAALAQRDNNGRGNDNGKGKGNDKGNQGDHGNGHGNGHGDDDDEGNNNGHGGDNGNHYGQYKHDVNNCGYKGHVCPDSYNGVGEPKCYFGVCTITCPRGQKLKHKHNQSYCA